VNWIIGGVALLIIGYIVNVLTKLDELGTIAMVVGAVVAVVGVVLLLVANRGGTRRL
jgi:TM2 domain-containing membrane protein YozV